MHVGGSCCDRLAQSDRGESWVGSCRWKLIDGKHKTDFSQVKFSQEEYHWDDKERHNNR